MFRCDSFNALSPPTPYDGIPRHAIQGFGIPLYAVVCGGAPWHGRRACGIPLYSAVHRKSERSERVKILNV